MANSVKIDGYKLQDWIKSTGKPARAISREMGYADNFLNCVKSRELISVAGLKMLCMMYGLPEDAFKPDPPKPVVKEEPKVNLIQPGYSISLQVYPKKIRMGLNYEGEEIQYAWSKGLDNNELALMQAISYAAHMMYKYAEQASLDNIGMD